ncbi:diaminopimelate decarboxylase-like [Daphnia pulicaria]|uniref:diaminopimelate decarboxylase-like n=1 Tax=Daphnia pulicaria TaxID=35523 RepID=UPI001EEBAA51|nr:diaminopimelate decarboxylase-like [Daphnia pulicaria]
MKIPNNTKNMANAQQAQLSTAFHYLNNNFYCENSPVHQIENELEKTSGCDDDDDRSATPLYIYSQAQLHRNIQSYKDAIHSAGMSSRMHIFYAVKANPNLHLMELVREQNCGAVTVSGYELKAALNTGFVPEMILLNGNGKQMWEIRLALKNGCMLNVDSYFDAENIISVARQLQKTARVLIRVNPGLEQSSTPVHSYLSTALKNSKFGIPLHQFDQVLELLRAEHFIQVVGLHCHVGSTIRDASIYSNVTRILLDIRQKLITQEYAHLKYLDIGGGLGIDYYHGTNQEQSPLSSTSELIQAIASLLPPDVEVIIEPGRSLVANTGILVTKVLGIKKSPDGGKNFLVVDAAMNDLIRPSFYQAYHHVLPVRKSISSERTYDIVGPICESGDFLAVDRRLPQEPVKGDLMAIMDIGAYGMAMASNYNMRARAAEVLVDGNSWKIIRRRENFESLVRTMTAD